MEDCAINYNLHVSIKKPRWISYLMAALGGHLRRGILSAIVFPLLLVLALLYKKRMTR